jgi:hypothetical protein
MFAKFNHSRAITKGDIDRNISTSSSPDTCGRISALYKARDFTKALRIRALGTRVIRNPKKRHFAMQSELRQVIYDYGSGLPYALSVAEKALEDQITVLKNAFRNEPMTGFKKPDSLETQEPRLDN